MIGRHLVIVFFIIMTHHTVLSLVLRMQRRIPTASRLFATTTTAVEPFRTPRSNNNTRFGSSQWQPSRGARLTAPKFSAPVLNRTRDYSSHSSGTFEDDDLDTAFDNVISSSRSESRRPENPEVRRPRPPSVCPFYFLLMVFYACTDSRHSFRLSVFTTVRWSHQLQRSRNLANQ
jgi:hypothetical protein